MTKTAINGEVLAPATSAEGFDWEALKASIELHGGIRNTVLVAEMPLHPPIRLLRSVADGIEPSFRFDEAIRARGPRR